MMMRCFLAGFWLLFAPVAALAQVRGEVESIGFQNIYRPDCWTPMTIKLVPETGKTDVYKIQVRQEDADRDRAIFEREISLTGNAEGQTREQRFRMYFIPQQSSEGLPDSRDPTMNLKDLNDSLVVNVCTAGGKQIARLPITATIQNIDPKRGMFDSHRGTRFILSVSDGRSQPIYVDRNTTSAVLGMVEDVVFVPVRPDDLPENVIGYDAIDGIVWLNADPASLRGGGDEKRRALDEYVRRGGRLVICQNAEWQKNLEFGELLPVEIRGVEDKQDARPLRDLAQPRPGASPRPPREGPDPWERLRGPFRLGRAEPRPGAVVDEWIEWDKDGKDRSAYIVRKRVGLGSVTWIAQDLGDPSITTRARTGWPFVWEHVFDWNNDPILLSGNESERDYQQYGQGTVMELGASMLGGIDLGSKTAWLITLAIVFFIAYWLVAGPGLFAYLVSRRRTGLSWFAFAGAALAATALTVLLVKAVLRGPPEMRHFSVVRTAPDQPAVVVSRLGLYIPRDGYQKIELKDNLPASVSSISALPMHPQFILGGRDMQGPEYTVPVVEAVSNEPASARFPYSSTLKKLQATWAGAIIGRVEGSARLIDPNWIEGSITNGTGQRLRNVYIAFKYPGDSGIAGDWMLYLPSWDAGVTLDLNKEFNKGDDGKPLEFVNPTGANPDGNRKVRGRLDQDWSRYWFPRFRSRMMTDSQFDDSSDLIRRSLPMLSFFERLAPMKNESQGRNDRVELLRRGARHLDVSQALAAGSLVVLAEAEGPLPFPLVVEGDPVRGSGTTFYQFILPLDRGKLTPEQESGTDGNIERP